MRKGKLRAASATGRRSSGYCTVTIRSWSTKLPRKFRAVSVNPLTMPSPNIFSAPRSEPGDKSSAYPKTERFRALRTNLTVDFAHNNINAPQDYHYIGDVLANTHVLEHGQVDQARRPHPVPVWVGRTVTDQIEAQLSLGRFNAPIGLTHLGTQAAQPGLRVHYRP